MNHVFDISAVDSEKSVCACHQRSDRSHKEGTQPCVACVFEENRGSSCRDCHADRHAPDLGDVRVIGSYERRKVKTIALLAPADDDDRNDREGYHEHVENNLQNCVRDIISGGREPALNIEREAREDKADHPNDDVYGIIKIILLIHLSPYL